MTEYSADSTEPNAKPFNVIEVRPELTGAAVSVIAQEYGVCSESAAERLPEDGLRAIISAWRDLRESSSER